jgi:parvulin-like peptidyl-prolyl isomerase
VLIAAVVFLVGILGYVGYGYYDDYKNDPLRAVVIEVNGVAFAMDYFVEALDIYVANYIGNTVNTYVDFYMQAYNVSREEAIQALTSNAVSELSLNTNDIADMITGQAADDIINGELLRQGAKNLDIEVTTAEIEAKLKEYELPDNRLYRDIMRASLLEEKLKEEYFDSGLNATMEQAQVQVVLVESEEVASELIAQVQAGGNLTALAEEFSCNFSVEGDLGWLPEELMPNALIANAAFNFTPPHLSEPIYDGAAVKDVGYWLIEVTAAHNETIDAQVMLLSSEAEAEQVRAELAAGGNFSALARTYSQHESRTQGGKLDGLKLGDMGSTAFDNVAFNITLNEVSEPVKDTLVQTTGGYWLVNVVDRGNRVLDQAVREKLVDKRYNDWRQEWAENSIIETHLDADKRTYAMNQVLARV